MRKIAITLLLLFAIIMVGCADTSKPSDSDVKAALKRAQHVRFVLSDGKPDWDYTVDGFRRDNGEPVGEHQYQVSGFEEFTPKAAGTKLADGKEVPPGTALERKVSVLFKKTEKGWKPIGMDPDPLGVFHPQMDRVIDRLEKKMSK